jgi:hypothetical protein
MWTETSGVIGVGYEGKDIASFLEELTAWKIGTVVDVRLNPISRKKGFSKKALSEALAEAGIGYSHMPALGNPKDNREGFWAPGTAAAKDAGERFESLLDSESAAPKRLLSSPTLPLGSVWPCCVLRPASCAATANTFSLA